MLAPRRTWRPSLRVWPRSRPQVELQAGQRIEYKYVVLEEQVRRGAAWRGVALGLRAGGRVHAGALPGHQLTPAPPCLRRTGPR